MNNLTKISTYVAFETIRQAMENHIDRSIKMGTPDLSSACWLSMMDELSIHVESWEHKVQTKLSELEKENDRLQKENQEFSTNWKHDAERKNILITENNRLRKELDDLKQTLPRNNPQ